MNDERKELETKGEEIADKGLNWLMNDPKTLRKILVAVVLLAIIGIAICSN